MEPYNAKTMPIDYPIDKEMLKLISEANAKYGEYKSLLNTLEFDAGFFLNSVIVNESYKSTYISDTKMVQEIISMVFDQGSMNNRDKQLSRDYTEKLRNLILDYQNSKTM